MCKRDGGGRGVEGGGENTVTDHYMGSSIPRGGKHNPPVS